MSTLVDSVSTDVARGLDPKRPALSWKRFRPAPGPVVPIADGSALEAVSDRGPRAIDSLLWLRGDGALE